MKARSPASFTWETVRLRVPDGSSRLRGVLSRTRQPNSPSARFSSSPDAKRFRRAASLMRVGRTPLDGSLPDLRRKLASLINGLTPLDRFLDWDFANADTVEFAGSDVDVELLNRVFHVYAEFTSDYIDATQLLDALRTEPIVERELAARRSAVA